ncbi:MAG: methyltransferase domain-containing protein [Phycisphaerae bacterium]|nr:methyltransferase domain-containing protein [Phycisphaerae bacterium]
MKFREATKHYLAVAALAFAIWQVTPRPVGSAFAQDKAKPSSEESAKVESVRPSNREASIRAIVAHLGLGKGSTICDIGAGRGRDSWVFAEIVGEAGAVIAEEIGGGDVKSLKEEAEKKGFSQVRSVLGRSEDPCLPPEAVDLAFMNHVYHHLAKPREMLRGIWRGLKPGGRLVVVDRRLGTLRDWVPRHVREEKHHWIAETTVVREAREEGFAFAECAEQCWHEKDHFVLVFQRPKKGKRPGRDPDLFAPVSVEKCSGLFLPVARSYRQPVFIALGGARKLMPPILNASSGKGLEVVLEEWATQKEERPPLAAGLSLPSVLTENGDANLGDEPIDVVFFLDSYHLLFHGKTLLAKIYEKLSPGGCVYVLDRRAEKPLSRREASHFRQIQPRTVRQEMAEAGFSLWSRARRPARDRFLLVFGKGRPGKVPPADNPFIGGPAISGSPGQWLKQNYWRLQGFETTDGSIVILKEPGRKGSVEKVPGASAGKQIWRIPKEKLELHFERKDGEYLLTDYRSSDQR